MGKSLKRLILNSEDYDIILQGLINLQENGYPLVCGNENWERLFELIAYFKFVCTDNILETRGSIK